MTLVLLILSQFTPMRWQFIATSSFRMALQILGVNQTTQPKATSSTTETCSMPPAFTQVVGSWLLVVGGFKNLLKSIKLRDGERSVAQS